MREREADFRRIYVAPHTDRWRDVVSNANPISGSFSDYKVTKNFLHGLHEEKIFRVFKLS
jgi:hypothetical protein